MSVQTRKVHKEIEKKLKKEIASSGNRTRAARVAGEHSTTEPTMLVDFVAMQQCSSCGRVVKATDSKSVSLWERRFESCRLRYYFSYTLWLSYCWHTYWLSDFVRRKETQHRWFSGRMLACHAGGPGSIPGRCNQFCVSFLFTPIVSLDYDESS